MNENNDMGVISYRNKHTILNGLNNESPLRIDLAQYAYRKWEVNNRHSNITIIIRE